MAVKLAQPQPSKALRDNYRLQCGSHPIIVTQLDAFTKVSSSSRDALFTALRRILRDSTDVPSLRHVPAPELDSYRFLSNDIIIMYAQDGEFVDDSGNS